MFKRTGPLASTRRAGKKTKQQKGKSRKAAEADLSNIDVEVASESKGEDVFVVL